MKKILMLLFAFILSVTLTACSTDDKKEETKEAELTGTEILGSTLWVGTVVKDENGEDVTDQYSQFISVAKFDSNTNQYEFFDAETGESKGDYGTYFVTSDNKYRVNISESKGYQAVLELTEMTSEIFTYKRTVGDDNTVITVEHVPYTGDLNPEFTSAPKEAQYGNDDIDTSTSGLEILGSTLWVGTTVTDADGNDLTAENSQFISVAKYDAKTNKYEFFDATTGESKGDFGYFDVIRDNKFRVHVSQGKEYAAYLELTTISNEVFTYSRMGKDKDGNEVVVFVEHVPYTGDLNPEFSN